MTKSDKNPGVNCDKINARARERYWAQAETRRRLSRERYARHKAVAATNAQSESAAIMRKRAERCKRYNLAKYAITAEQYARLLEQQKGVCAICGKVPGVNDKLVVDHSHFSGKVRGLLCRKHNVALGLLGDTADSLAAVLEYLGAAKLVAP